MPSFRRLTLGCNRHGRRRPQRPLRIERWYCCRRSVGAEGDGWPGKTGNRDAGAPFRRGLCGLFRRRDRLRGAKQHKKDASKAIVTCAVSIGPREGGGFGLSVKMHIEDKSMKQAELVALVKEAHEKICPYSHATRNNVDVAFDVAGG